MVHPVSKSEATWAQLRRYKWLLAVFWTGAVALSLAWNIRDQNRATGDMARSNANIAFEKDVLYRRWAAGHGGVYAPATEKTPPNPYLSQIAERDITTPSGRKLTLINPAYMTRQVHELGEEQDGVKGHITSLNPLRPENSADRWEAEALKAFEHGATKISSVEEMDGHLYMRLMRPLHTEQGCLKCHAAQGYELGDVRGGISVSVPMAPLQAIARSRTAALCLGHGGLWLVGLAGVAAGMRHAHRHMRQRYRAEDELRAQTRKLDERLKELTCMYGVAGAIQTRDTLEAVFRDIVALIPPGWQYPEIARGRIHFDGKDYVSEPFEQTRWRQTSDIIVGKERRGFVEVCYLEQRPDLDEGPFLQEERNLVDSIAQALSEAAERKQAEEALAKSEQKFMDIFYNSADATLLIDGETFVDCNEKTVEMLRASKKEEVLATHPSELSPETQPDGRSSFEKANEMIATAFERGSNRFEWDHRRLDGELFSVEVTLMPVPLFGKQVLYCMWKDITEFKETQAELQTVQQQLVEASREAGMSEVATGVLHNVGNVLTSLNVSAGMIAEKMRASRVANLGKATKLMSEHADDLASYITQDETGKQLPGYLNILAEHLAAEQASIIGELEAITDNVEHIKTIVSMQQSYTRVSGIAQSIALAGVIDDVLKLDTSSLTHHDIEVARDYDEVPPVVADKHKLLQILANLLKNAKHALIHRAGQPRRLTVRLGSSGEDGVSIEVIDNGVGIPPENLSRIFEYGFTTKKTGHGFGLHSSAVAATELGGSLTVHSDGPGTGATFTLELPLQPARTDNARSTI